MAPIGTDEPIIATNVTYGSIGTEDTNSTEVEC